MTPMIRRTCIAMVLALLLLPAFQAQAQQTAQIHGTVTLKGNTPARGYVVQVGQYWSYTDAKGRYRIDNVPYGEYTLEVKRRRSVVWHAKVQVRGKVITRNVTL